MVSRWVYPRATRIASRVDSVPDAVKRTRSADGTSSITLSGDNTYTGDTSVLGGTLSINNACLADTADALGGIGA